jgi:predicted ATPase/DNA-binding SARP family transcriptional activator
MVQIRLLGGFGLLVDGKTVQTESWRLRKARDVVKLLALAPGHRRHRDEVVEALWPERDIDSGLNNLHQALHIARRGLAGPEGSGRQRLRCRDEWVALCPDQAIRVDVEEFEAAAAAADGSADPVGLDAALTLYQGDLLPEDRYEDWVLTRREELRALRRRLITRLAALREESGHPHAAADLLRLLVADDPADEVAQRALMRAYALGGDRAAALRQHQVLTSVLQDALAVPPDAETERVHQEVLSGQLSGGQPAGQAPGAAARSGTGNLPERAGSRRPFRRPPASPRAGHNLPVRLSTFVGRGRALDDLTALVGQRRLVTLTGPGGCGKTRLAVEVAHRALPQFPNGAWLTELAVAAGRRDQGIDRALAQSLSLREQSGQSPLDAVTADLAGKRALLVIDNCEHRIDSAAAAITELLQACPEVVVLATSREPLRVPGEVLWRVPSLAMADPRQLPTVQELGGCESVRLFVERAIAAEPGFRLDEDNAPAVAEICFRLDGLPLAIELAAARVPALGVAAIAARLDDRFQLLTDGSRTGLSRQRTLAAAFDWSYELLSQVEQAAFRRMSVFAETFSLPAAAAVASGDGVERENMAFVLPDLVARSMISIEQEPVAFRYRLIETLREYGRQRLDEAGETKSVRCRHAAWYLTLAREAASHFAQPGRRLWFERVDADWPDFQIALTTLLDAEPARALNLVASLWPYWVLRGNFGEGLERLRAALAAWQEPSPARVEALLGAFGIQLRWTGMTEKNPHAEQALEEARCLGHPLSIARAEFFTGVQAWMADDFESAWSSLRAAAATAGAAGLVMAEASAVHGMACVAWSEGELERAGRMLRRALALARRGAAQDDPGSFWQLTLGSIGTAVWMGVPHLVFEETYVPFQENQGMAAVAYIRASMGSLARSAGDYGTAQRRLTEALGLFEDAGDQAGVALALGRLGNLAIVTRQEPEARDYLARSLAVHRQLRDQRGIGLALMSLGRLEAGSGRLDSASDLFGEAADFFRASGDRPALVGALTRLGELQLARVRKGSTAADIGGADPGGEAVRLLESAAANLRVMGHSAHLALGLTALAEAYATVGGRERAGDAAREAIALLAYAPAEPGRDRALRRMSVIAEHS